MEIGTYERTPGVAIVARDTGAGLLGDLYGDGHVGRADIGLFVG